MHFTLLILILEGPGPWNSLGQADFHLGLEGRQHPTGLDWGLRQAMCNLVLHTEEYMMHSRPLILKLEGPGSRDSRGQAVFTLGLESRQHSTWLHWHLR